MKTLVTLALAALAACRPLVPATTPPQLGSTPGPAIIVVEDAVIMGDWRLPVPPGWKIVKNSTADAPALSVVLVSPDEQMLIIASEGPLPPPAIPGPVVVQFQQRVLGRGRTLYAAAQAAPPQRDALRRVWDAFLAGLNSPP